MEITKRVAQQGEQWTVDSEIKLHKSVIEGYSLATKILLLSNKKTYVPFFLLSR